MSLAAGVMHVTLQFAQNLRDMDWFGKQDPYAVITIGSQSVRSRTAVDGGKAPVWNETFNFSVINDNTMHVTLKDEDVASKDDVIGTAVVSLAKAREVGLDSIQAPVMVPGGKQRGFVAFQLRFETNNAGKLGKVAQPGQVYAQQPYATPYGASPAAPYGAQPGYAPQQPAYGAPPYGAPAYPPTTMPPATGPYAPYPQQYPPPYMGGQQAPQPAYPPQHGYPPQQRYAPQPAYAPQPGYAPQQGYPQQPGYPGQPGYPPQQGYMQNPARH